MLDPWVTIALRTTNLNPHLHRLRQFVDFLPLSNRHEVPVRYTEDSR
jgi:hypothetical protein